MKKAIERPRLMALGLPETRWVGVALCAVLVVGAGVRLQGLRWGLPGPSHYYSYHPDEGTIVGGASRINIFTGDLNPHFFNYGSLQLYLVHVACQFASGWGYLDFGPAGRGFIETVTRTHLVARLLTVLMGGLTVWAVWLLGRKVGGEEAGLWGAALMALCGGHVVNSHYATVDVPLTLWTTLCLLACLAILSDPSTWRYVAAGVTLGFACATKYGAVVLVVPLVVAYLLSGEGRRALGVWRSLGVAAGSAVGAFLGGCPYSVLAWPEFLRDVWFEAEHMRTGSGLLFAGTGNGWLYHLRESLPLSLSWPVLLGVLVGALMVARRRPREAAVLLSFVWVYFAMLGSAEVRFSRYVLHLLPPLLTLGALGLAPTDDSRQHSPRRLLLGGLLLVSCMHTYLCDRAFSQTDPRDAAAAWIEGNVPRTETIGLVNLPWFYTPPLVPYNGGAKSREVYEQDPSARRYPLLVTGWDAASLSKERPPCFAVSEFEFREELRLCGKPLSAPRVASQGAQFRDFARFWNRLNDRCEVAGQWGGWRAPVWLAPTGYVPHDWLYPQPETRVYRLHRRAELRLDRRRGC